MAVDQEVRLLLLNLHSESGLSLMLATARKMLDISLHKKVNKSLTDTNIVLGSIGATVLEACILEFTKVYRKSDWHLFQSVVLPDLKSENTDFLTEVDMLLVTPACLYSFEVKTYKGAKRLVGEGIIVREKYKNFNIFQQQKVHSLALNSTLGDFRDKSYSILDSQKAPLFDYSTEPMIDQRSKEMRRFMPLLNEDLIFKYLSNQAKNYDVVWDVSSVVKVVNLLIEKGNSVDLRGKHLNYVKSLHRGKN